MIPLVYDTDYRVIMISIIIVAITISIIMIRAVLLIEVLVKQNMSEELFHEVTADLQRMIQIKDEQLRLVNSCSIILVDGSK